MLKMEHIRAAFPEGCLAANLSLIPIPNPAKAQKRKLNGFTIAYSPQQTGPANCERSNRTSKLRAHKYVRSFSDITPP